MSSTRKYYGDDMRFRSHIPFPPGQTFLSRFLQVVLLAGVLCILAPRDSIASISNRLYRVEIRPKQNYTRVSIKFENPPQYTLSILPGNRLRVTITDTGGPLLRRYRRYSDTNIGGLAFVRRGNDLMVTFPVASGRGWRDVGLEGVSALAIDVGKAFSPPPPRHYLAGREKIWNGVEKLVRDFDPPLKPEIPFLPTDRAVLKGILDTNDVEAFVAAEGALYKGRLSEAAEVFAPFAGRQAAVRPLALYRLGETLYKQQNYPQALAAFREAERLWPAFLGFNPGVTFYYGDSIARGGDLAAARNLLAGLIARLADKKFAPVLLVRLADILVRQGHDREALGLYRTVADNFSDNKANLMARLRLNDRQFLSAAPWNYRRLAGDYQAISRQSGDIDLREESYFKSVLLESIHGDASEALGQVVQFQKKFPRGVYAAVCRTMREVLVVQSYLQTPWKNDPAGLIRFAEEHQEYLAGCIEQPEFLVKVARAYEEAGRPLELIKQFNALLDHQWAAPGAPFMYEAVADNADLLGDSAMAEKTLQAFLRKYPAHPRSRVVLEHLGGLYYSDAKYQETRDTLIWLLNKGERAQNAESYYYLGRALWQLKQALQSSRAMELYLAQTSGQGERAERLLPDAYFVAISARESLGDHKGALRLLEAGLKLPSNAHSDELLYKAGELSLAQGKAQQARGYFQQIVKNGKDSDWQKLAQQAIVSLDVKVGAGVKR